ncbi:hypothetical protein TYRP_018009 [Tyrophagus putrescentiae]|nr:hypothetical protein TYRP_018009 [Tyrophagus putrescentiae]
MTKLVHLALLMAAIVALTHFNTTRLFNATSNSSSGGFVQGAHVSGDGDGSHSKTSHVVSNKTLPNNGGWVSHFSNGTVLYSNGTMTSSASSSSIISSGGPFQLTFSVALQIALFGAVVFFFANNAALA